MDIKSVDYKWNGTLVKRNETRYIILHHRAGNGDAESIHAQHLSQGWTGIGYHFYVRKDGTVYAGRPLDVIGAHCQGHNSYSVGVCFEGNFEKEQMPSAQLKAGQELITYLKTKYPKAEVLRHKDFGGSACPGKNFPFEEIGKGDYPWTPSVLPSASQLPQGGSQEGKTRVLLESANDIIWELSQRIEIHEVDRAVAALEKAKNEDSSLYWILYKLVNREDK